jgi:hypothetical protein
MQKSWALAIVGLLASTSASVAKPKPVKPKAKAKVQTLADDPPPPAAPPRKAPPSMARPTAEVAELAKALIGTWRCTGTLPGAREDDPAIELTAVLRYRFDVEKVWLHDELEAKTDAASWRLEGFVTYDPSVKAWRRVGIGGDGGYLIATAPAVKDHLLTWDGTIEGPRGAASLRERVDLADPKALKLTRERSTDQGQTWAPTLQLSCARAPRND